MAKKQNWLLHKNNANGNSLTLQGLDVFGYPVYYTTHNVIASVGTATNELYKGGSIGVDLKGDLPALNGRFCIWDGGLPLLNHVEFGGRIAQQDQNRTLSNHTTHLIGTMAAAGVNPQAKGMAYEAHVDVWDYTDDLVEMTKQASKMLISNHAYGPIVGWYFNENRPSKDPNLKWEWWGNTSVSNFEDYRFGYYDEKARDLDFLTYNNPFYLIVKSADNKRAENGPPAGTPYFIRNTNTTSTQIRSRNDSYDIIPAEANAKNILTVGAANINLSNDQRMGFSVANFSGWGPTDDGRIKPDLLGVGTGILSAVTTAANAYGVLSGTSTASANVSGTLILLQELHHKQQNYFMRSATLKGLTLHTADKPGSNLGPSYEYGWGLLNAEKAAKVILNNDQKHFMAEQTLRQNEVFRKRVMANANEPLVVTICWTDPEGTPARINTQTLDDRSLKLVNDLDIRITDNLGVGYLPWVLNPEFPDRLATTGDNTRDNVEQITIAKPVVGRTYTITVSHKRTLRSGNQPYSIFISGLLPQDCAAATRIIAGADTILCGGNQLNFQIKGDIGLSYTWLKNGQPLSTTNTPTLAVSQAGQYAVRAVGYQCFAESKSINVKYDALTAKIQPAGEIAVCAGTPLQLTTNQGDGYQYQWKRNGQALTNAKSATLVPTELGDYTVSISFNNCTAISVPTRLTSIVQIPAISTNTGTAIPTKGSIRLTTTVEPEMTYQWLWNGRPIPTATGPRYSAIAPGEYSVKITQKECSLTSKPLVLTWADKTQGNLPIVPENVILKQNLQLFPNPVAETLTVTYLSEDTYNLTARILNLYGQVLEEKLLFDNGKEFANQFEVSRLSSGMYFVEINDGFKAVSLPFIKK